MSKNRAFLKKVLDSVISDGLSLLVNSRFGNIGELNIHINNKNDDINQIKNLIQNIFSIFSKNHTKMIPQALFYRMTSVDYFHFRLDQIQINKPDQKKGFNGYKPSHNLKIRRTQKSFDP